MFRSFLYLTWLTFTSALLPVSGCQSPLLSCENACGQLSSIFGSAVHFPGSDNFTVWDAKQTETRSACRITPSSTLEVSQIMSILVQSWCRFAVKGGGHARNVDDSVSLGGVTIDMVNMRSIQVLDGSKRAKVGSGHILFSLYSGLEKFGLGFPGGRVADVGLGGFALGGGLSNWGPQYGLMVDNIFEYEIVLANSTVWNVTESSHPGLYKSLRGGMNNFGVVTHFTVRVFPTGKIWSGSSSLTADNRDTVIQQSYELTTRWKTDKKMTFSYGYGYNPKQDRFSIGFSQYYTDAVENPEPYKVINALNRVSSTLRVDSMSNFSLEVASARPPGARNLYATLSFYPSQALEKQIQDIYAEEIQSVKNTTGISPNLIFQPFFEGALRSGRERGGNALSVEGDDPFMIVLLTTGWSSANDDSRMYAFANRFVQRAEAATEAAGKTQRWKYINYASQNQDPFGGYGEESRRAMIEVQKEVDPLGVFTSRGLCRGYFKLV